MDLTKKPPDAMIDACVTMIEEEQLALSRELGDPGLLIHALGGMGHLMREEGDYARARSFYAEPTRG